MKKLICAVLALAFAGAVQTPVSAQGPSSPPSSTIFIASDSTAAEYGPPRYPQMGWGMVLKCSLDPSVAVVNLAKGGRSTRTFIAEGWFKQIEDAIRPGDTLLIQFGHNDEFKGKPERYTPIPDFKRYLKTYVKMAKRHKAQPILITPVTKREFDGDRQVNSLAEYAMAVREVAGSTRTPLIDLNADSQLAVQVLGPEMSKAYYLYYKPEDKAPPYPNGIEDNTHFNERGARLMAGLVANRLAKLPAPVARQVKPSAKANTAFLGGPGCP